MINFTESKSCVSTEIMNASNITGSENSETNFMFSAISILIGVCGLLGNILVISVILKSSKMKTVTNMYIFTLALSDLIFILHIAMVATTDIIKHWIFGEVLCKIFWITSSLTMYSSVLTLSCLSFDRYIAVCKPVISQRHRQPTKAGFVIVCIWGLSLLLSLPMILYSKRMLKRNQDTYVCTIDWPDSHDVLTVPAYTIYNFIIGCAIPLCFISIFYTCVIIHMKGAGPANRQRSNEQRRNHRKVTLLVLAIILVYGFCWLPYWIMMIAVTLQSSYDTVPMVVMHIITILTYINSMVNPILYAFLSENFRQKFKEVFQFSCICKKRVRYFLQRGNTNAVELDIRRPVSNQTEAETNQDYQADSQLNQQRDNGGVYTGMLEQ